MALARAVLHVGPAKTGSTSIQAALAACRLRLLQHGIYYPPTRPESDEGQPSLAWDVLAESGKPVARLSRASVSWDEAVAGAERAGAHTLLVSSEDFSSDAFDERAFMLLRRRLMRLPVDVVFALRDPRLVVPSIWSHSVRWGIGCGEEALSLREAAPLILSRRSVRVVDYLTAVERYLQPVRINLLTVPRKADRTVLLSRFADCCGFSEQVAARILETAGYTDGGSSNAALAARYVAVLLTINQAVRDREGGPRSRESKALRRSIEVRQRLLDVIQKDAAGNSVRRVALPAESRSAAEDIGREILRWIDAQTARVCGDASDVWAGSSKDESQDDVGPAPTEAEISKAAMYYLNEAGSAILAEARFWREQASNWEGVCSQLRRSWSWRISKPLRLAGPLLSALDRLRGRD